MHRWRVSGARGPPATGRTAAPRPRGRLPGVSVKDVPQGAATSVLLAASPLVEGVTGRYFEDCQKADLVQPGIRRGVAPYALDPEKADRLWALSEELLATPLPPEAGRR